MDRETIPVMNTIERKSERLVNSVYFFDFVNDIT